MSDSTARESTPGRRSVLAIVVALLVFTGLVVWVHGYFAQRLIVDTGLPAPWAGAALWTLTLLGGSIFLHPVLERRFGRRVARLSGWPAYVWLGCCFYLLWGFLIADLVFALAGLEGEAAARTRALAVGGAVALIALIAARSALRVPAVRRVEHPLPAWPAALDGYRIVQISDIHVGALIGEGYLRRVVERCNELDADVIAITGDLVDGRVSDYGPNVRPLADLRARDGVYFVTGNHDHFSRAVPWLREIAALGVQVLSNRRVRIARGDVSYELAGVDDYSAGTLDRGHGHDLQAALSGWDGDSPVVLLAHDPRSFKQASAGGVHLQLSGHTHGGQMWPFSWFVRLQTPYVAGPYERGDSRLYVSRGTGFWGPPMRLLAPAEISEHVLRSVGTDQPR